MLNPKSGRLPKWLRVCQGRHIDNVIQRCAREQGGSASIYGGLIAPYAIFHDKDSAFLGKLIIDEIDGMQDSTEGLVLIHNRIEYLFSRAQQPQSGAGATDEDPHRSDGAGPDHNVPG